MPGLRIKHALYLKLLQNLISTSFTTSFLLRVTRSFPNAPLLKSIQTARAAIKSAIAISRATATGPNPHTYPHEQTVGTRKLCQIWVCCSHWQVTAACVRAWKIECSARKLQISPGNRNVVVLPLCAVRSSIVRARVLRARFAVNVLVEAINRGEPQWNRNCAGCCWPPSWCNGVSGKAGRIVGGAQVGGTVRPVGLRRKGMRQFWGGGKSVSGVSCWWGKPDMWWRGCHVLVFTNNRRASNAFLCTQHGASWLTALDVYGWHLFALSAQCSSMYLTSDYMSMSEHCCCVLCGSFARIIVDLYLDSLCVA